MRIVPVLFPSDLGHSERGAWSEGGERGAPDLLLGLLESEGVRISAPVTVPVPRPDAAEGPDAPLKFDGLVAEAVRLLAEAVAEVNANADFPLVLGGDQLATMGHILGHSARHSAGIGLGVLCDAYADLDAPGRPTYDDKKARRSEDDRPTTGNASRMTLTGCLRLIPENFALGRLMAKSALVGELTTVAGVRSTLSAQQRRMQRKSGVDLWTMERIELDGEAAWRTSLTSRLARGPTVLSIDVTGIDPELMGATREPVSDGLDWGFLRRSLDPCLPHRDRILGLDVTELDPKRDDAHNGAQSRLAETLAPFLKKLA